MFGSTVSHCMRNNLKKTIFALVLLAAVAGSAQAQFIQPLNPQGRGPVLGNADLRVREWRNTTIPQFSTKVDNFSQFAPVAVMYSMKLAGIEGRGSSWTQVNVSSAASMAIMLATTTAMKYTISEMRPDGSTANSFPSGHTANAFMCATLLHKEYGRDYPWLSAGGYAVAALTGASRIANNRHWLGDVLCGAALGILSAELGDLISRRLSFRRK